MPRFFFDLYNDIDAQDPEGRELPSRDAAWAVALEEAREMMQDGIAQGNVELRHRIEVRDESGTVIHTLHFEDAVRILRAGQPI